MYKKIKNHTFKMWTRLLRGQLEVLCSLHGSMSQLLARNPDQMSKRESKRTELNNDKGEKITEEDDI
jgi:hypothetical protein